MKSSTWKNVPVNWHAKKRFALSTCIVHLPPDVYLEGILGVVDEINL